ncbi:MAG: hypothetical protein WHS46_01530 [Desulfosoma sp.]
MVFWEDGPMWPPSKEIGYSAVPGVATHWVGFDNVPSEVCQSLDEQYDDGVWNTGSICGSGNYGGNPNTTYDLYFKM